VCVVLCVSCTVDEPFIPVFFQILISLYSDIGAAVGEGSAASRFLLKEFESPASVVDVDGHSSVVPSAFVAKSRIFCRHGSSTKDLRQKSTSSLQRTQLLLPSGSHDDLFAPLEESAAALHTALCLIAKQRTTSREWASSTLPPRNSNNAEARTKFTDS
jgi:hypothetical protein